MEGIQRQRLRTLQRSTQTLNDVSARRNVPDRDALFRLLWRCEKSQGCLVLRREECQGTIWDRKRRDRRLTGTRQNSSALYISTKKNVS